MVSELLAGLGAFKAMFDLAKGLKDANDAATRNAVAIELQEKILTAQTQQAALIARVEELEKQVVEFENWDSEKERYQLTELPPGVFVYAVKEEARGGEPPHKLCANCFQQRKKSILNSDEPSSGVTKLHCPSCGWQDRIGHFRAPPIDYGGGGGHWMGS